MIGNATGEWQPLGATLHPPLRHTEQMRDVHRRQ
jgi:hypothetical protein